MRELRGMIAATLVAWCALGAGAAWAQSGPKLQLTIDRPIIALNGQATVELVISNASSVEGAPRFPASQGFTLVGGSPTNAFSLERGSVTSSVTFPFRLAPTAKGDWTLGPAEVQVDGRVVRTEAIAIKVVDGIERSSSAPAMAAASQHYARAKVSNTRPFAGESLTWTLEVGSSARIRQPKLPALPDVGGLSAEPGIEPQWQTEMTVQDGRRVEVWRAVLPLFAVEPGPTRIGATPVILPEVMNGTGMFARVRELELSAAATALEVLPLPAGRPTTFSGAVGQFRIRATLGATTVATGDTVTLSVQLDGTGALRAPELAIAVPDSVRMYDEAPDVQVALVGDEVHSRAIFKTALVPLRPGRVTIPPITFSYFDPKTRRYADAESAPLMLTVTGDPVAEPAVSRSEGIAGGKEQVEILASDILPLRGADRILGDARARPGSPVVLSLLIFPLVLFGGLAGVQWRQRRAGTASGRRAARNKEARAAVLAGRAAAEGGDWGAADEALRAFLTVRIGRPGASLSPGEARDVLTEAGAAADLAAGAATLISRVEECRYGGLGAGTLATDIGDWLVQAEREWRG